MSHDGYQPEKFELIDRRLARRRALDGASCSVRT